MWLPESDSGIYTDSCKPRVIRLLCMHILQKYLPTPFHISDWLRLYLFLQENILVTSQGSARSELGNTKEIVFCLRTMVLIFRIKYYLHLTRICSLYLLRCKLCDSPSCIKDIWCQRSENNFQRAPCSSKEMWHLERLLCAWFLVCDFWVFFKHEDPNGDTILTRK